MRLNLNAQRLSLYILLLTSIGLMGCTQLLQRQTCVTLAENVHYCLAPLPNELSHTRDKPLAKPLSNITTNTVIANQPSYSQAAALLPQSFSQKVNIKVADKSHELLTQIELEGERMTLVGLAPLGQALFTLVYDGNTLSSEQNVLLGDSFKAEYLMAMMQLIYWPEQSVRAHLEGGHLMAGFCDAIGDTVGDTLVDTQVNTNLCRQIYSQDGLNSKSALQTNVVQIRYQQQVGDTLWQARIHLTMPLAKFALDIEPI
ncbi:DUF3261 domain-containing protein [Shewanella morhuae]|uniref:DUF3261 domain-containing protein n=1 Tax=Shewanella morhuae TaxID=365591 RepID=A0ABX5HQD4_9GAMM|nr:DUF3261 domain-containing protein [Shewanella morhuae]PTA48915.1 DUF3261 domain-containing protein [Shewanella morhuae]